MNYKPLAYLAALFVSATAHAQSYVPGFCPPAFPTQVGQTIDLAVCVSALADIGPGTATITAPNGTTLTFPTPAIAAGSGVMLPQTLPYTVALKDSFELIIGIAFWHVHIEMTANGETHQSDPFFGIILFSKANP